MPKANVLVTVRHPEGEVTRHKAYRAYAGEHRVTWISMSGMRSYVLLRHGFEVSITNL